MKRAQPAVLVLEPNPLQCDLIKMALTRHAMTPIVCARPEALLQELREYLPDVLLIDTALPGQNGLDLIDQLHSDVLLQKTKVFFISALGYPEIVQRAARLGASGFLVKPVDPDLLVKRILKAFVSQKQFSL